MKKVWTHAEESNVDLKNVMMCITLAVLWVILISLHLNWLWHFYLEIIIMYQDMLYSAKGSLLDMRYVSFTQAWTPALDLTSAGVCDLSSVAWRDVRGYELVFLLVVNVECDVTLIRVQAARRRREETSLRVLSLPQSLPSCQSQCCLNVPGAISGGEKSLSTLKGSGGKTRVKPAVQIKISLG